ncbi:MAG: hypothetical protein J7J17_02450 [Hadesarchaea archaeon]|nr:hypothetical protein [Hadesarchaea archaeon]
MIKASAFVPGHVSGFFQVCDESEDLVRRGSRNCGPCITAGVRTDVFVRPRPQSSVMVFIDGKEAPEARTSTRAVEMVLETVGTSLDVTVQHNTHAPIGAGYGLSGAGALGAVLALSKALGLGLGRNEAASVAHVAEVSCGTGLGDVGAQVIGGLVIGLEPGAPPYGKWERIEVPEDLVVVCGTLGPLRTERFLRDLEFKRRSKELGGKALASLMKSPTLQNFMRVSEHFSREVGILEGELLEIIGEISKSTPFGASAVMLGRAVFAPARRSELDRVKEIFLEFFEPDSIFTADVDFEGARLI